MAENYESVSKVYENIIKSEGDSRAYKGLELINGMRILLISDPTTDISAAALNVCVGYMSDPPELPGLAHFCEHMLFLGNEKYSTENDYDKFILQHGGSLNAYTDRSNTCYHFDVAPNSLKDALDRFAQFFLCPLFTESSTEREVNAVHSEYEMKLKNDSWRLSQIETSTCNPKHDYSKFGVGNIETLWNIPRSKGISIRDELLKFYEKYYSSNIMSLVVLGKETIEELTDIVVPLFSNVSNKNVEIPEWKEHPLDDSCLKMESFVVPVKDIRFLKITFPIPDMQPLYKSGPDDYLSQLTDHGGPGSFHSALKRYGWINDLESGYESGSRGFAFYSTTLQLTEEGFDHVNDIVTHFFHYLAMLKEEGPQEWIFEEYKKILLMSFRFKNKENPETYAISLARKMFRYPMEDILFSSYLLHTYEPDLINNLLDMLTPDNIRITVVGKRYENLCNEVEKWSGARYKLQPIPESVLDTWRNAKPHPDYKFPSPNEFIPASLELVPREADNPKYPQLIKNTAMGRLWFKQDDEFLLPKATLDFHLQSPLVNFDPLHRNMAVLFVDLVKDSLEEYTYATNCAGLSYSLGNDDYGIHLGISGYNDKQHILLKKIMDRLTNFKIDEKRFNILKTELHRCKKNFSAQQPHCIADYFLLLLLLEHAWTYDELLNCVDDITIEGMQQMILGFFSKVHIEALIHGNLTTKDALSLMDIVESTLEKNMNTKCLIPSQLTKHREVKLSDGHHYVYEVMNDIHSCSCVAVYYQCGIERSRSNMLLELLCELIFEPCYDILRTREQLGYIVWSRPFRLDSVQGIRILVQSDKLPCYVDGRIEAFIQYFDRYIQDMCDEEFRKHIQSLSTSRSEKPKKLYDQTEKYWNEIITRHFNFDRDNIELSTLQTITKEELYSYFKELIAKDAPKRRKLSVCVKSYKSTNDVPDDTKVSCSSEAIDDTLTLPPESKPPVKIDNITEFKHSLGLYPLVLPYMSIPPSTNAVSEKLNR